MSREIGIVRLVVRAITMGALSAIIVGIYSLTLENQYTATASLILSPLPVAVSESKEDSKAEHPATEVNFLMAKPLTVPDYRILLTNSELVAHLKERWIESRKARGKTNTKLRLEEVAKAMAVDIRIYKQTVYDIVYQPIIQLSFTANDPNTAAELVNEWAQQGILLAGEIDKMGEEGMIDFLKRQLDEKAVELQADEKKIEELESQLILKNWQQRIMDLDIQVTKFQTRAAELTTEISGGQAQLAQLEAILQNVPDKVSLRKAASEDAYWLIDAMGKKPDSKNILESEEINDVHGKILEKKSTVETELRGKEAERKAIDEELARMKSDIESLQRQVAEHNRLYCDAKRDLETHEVQYKQLAVNYGAARIAEAKNVPDLKLANKAVPPDTKTGPHRSLMVIAAAMLGILIVPIHYWLMVLAKVYVAGVRETVRA
ncbi:MAG: hypothetical protein K1Y02_03860 [Candidatus Hydrogenedentes bacterium]|nr:hypothetical protein [Candidatus Hydrogenedentota bacterium]